LGPRTLLPGREMRTARSARLFQAARDDQQGCCILAHTLRGRARRVAPCKFTETQRRFEAPQSLCNCCCQRNSQRCVNLTRRARRQLHRSGSPRVAPPGLRRAASLPAAHLPGSVSQVAGRRLMGGAGALLIRERFLSCLALFCCGATRVCFSAARIRRLAKRPA
jgi:hypothetical protein